MKNLKKLKNKKLLKDLQKGEANELQTDSLERD